MMRWKTMLRTAIGVLAAAAALWSQTPQTTAVRAGRLFDPKSGQMLAVLETPELDQQLETARGNLRQSQANFELARVTAQRWAELARKLVVSRQDNDTQQSNYQAATAALTAKRGPWLQLSAPPTGGYTLKSATRRRRPTSRPSSTSSRPWPPWTRSRW